MNKYKTHKSSYEDARNYNANTTNLLVLFNTNL